MSQLTNALGPAFASIAAAAPQSMVNEEAVMAVLGGAVGVVVAFVMLVALLKRFLKICGPHEILVFSGRAHTLDDGTTVNYKILHGGRGFRVPFLEMVRAMDMRLIPVEVAVANAFSKGGIPLDVRAIANVKLSSNDRIVRNAVERFLEYHPSQIAEVARQTLEGVLREVISQLTPEEVNEDRLKFAEQLLENARDDFDKLGLELDVLKVQHVSDDQEYLKNLGRARVATMLRDAENAENEANQLVTEARAEATQRAETAAKQAETRVVQTRNEANGNLARLDAQAQQIENQAQMAVETARVRAEQRLQELRAELEKRRLFCDVVLPAAAQRQAQELRARGEAAPAIENGKASAEALRLVSTEWAAAGDYGRDVYVLQQLGTLVEAATQRVSKAEIGTIRIVGGDEDAYSTVAASHPAAVARVLRETSLALGIDVGRLLAPPTLAAGGDNDLGRAALSTPSPGERAKTPQSERRPGRLSARPEPRLSSSGPAGGERPSRGEEGTS